MTVECRIPPMDLKCTRAGGSVSAGEIYDAQIDVGDVRMIDRQFPVELGLFVSD